MAIRGGAKQKSLQYFITDFAVEIGFKADKQRYNKSWAKLWKRIHRIKLFNDTQNLRRQ